MYHNTNSHFFKMYSLVKNFSGSSSSKMMYFSSQNLPLYHGRSKIHNKVSNQISIAENIISKILFLLRLAILRFYIARLLVHSFSNSRRNLSPFTNIIRTFVRYFQVYNQRPPYHSNTRIRILHFFYSSNGRSSRNN